MDGRKKMRKDSKVFRKFHLNLELYTYITKTTKRAGRIGKLSIKCENRKTLSNMHNSENSPIII